MTDFITRVALVQGWCEMAWPDLHHTRLFSLSQAAVDFAETIEAANQVNFVRVELRQSIHRPLPDERNFTEGAKNFTYKLGVELWRKDQCEFSGGLTLGDEPRLDLSKRGIGWAGEATYLGNRKWKASVFESANNSKPLLERPGYTETDLGRMLGRLLAIVP